MQIANLDGRLVVLDGSHAYDVESASDGRFDADPQAIFSRWKEFLDWASTSAHLFAKVRSAVDVERLGPPVPRPPQVFGIGLNYRDHAAEASLELPIEPMVFTKFPTAITGPKSSVVLSSQSVDYEVELVAVIGAEAVNVPSARGWDHIAGLMVGQDISDRAIQFRDSPPQFSLGKSFAGYAPTGPVLVTPDEFTDPNRLTISCVSRGETLQRGTTGDMVFSVGELVARLSSIVRLLPGDLIFTGTPAGVGGVKRPPRYLQPGDTLVSSIEGIGQLETHFVASGGGSAT